MQTTQMVHPFHIHIDAMERLLLINFEEDPDTTYVGFEPQVFDDPVNGTGHLIIGWRQDGRVDVFHQPGLHLDAQKYDIAGKGLADMVERDIVGAYEIDDFGVQAHYEFRDLHDRFITLHIREQHPRVRKPFGLLAPMGAVASAPSALPLVLLHDFYFVRKQHTVIHIIIDGRRHQPDQLPLPIDRVWMYFTRYCPRPLIATFNPAHDGALAPVNVEVDAAEVTVGETTLALEWTEGRPALRRLTRHNPVYPLALRLDPAFPDLHTLSADVRIVGNFEIAGHPSTGLVAGDYAIEKRAEHIDITLRPSRGWQPRPSKVSLYFLYMVAGIFKQWPTTYEWTARIQADEAGVYTLRSAWRRIAG